MARWENEDLSGLNIPDVENVVTDFYDKYGDVCPDKHSVAKAVKISKDGKNTMKYYVKFFRGELIDPHSIDYNTKTKAFTFKKVSEKTFNQYFKYLKTKNRLYFTRSRRLSREN